MQAIRRLGLILVFTSLILALVAFGQQPAGPAAPAAPTPAAALDPLWNLALSSGVPGLLLIGFVFLWRHFNKKDDDHTKEREAWTAEKIRIKETHDVEKSRTKDAHDLAVDRAWEEARKDKQALRESFERQLLAMQTKLDSMQTRLDKEQSDRRQENERLLREQTTLTREVMTTAQGLITGLEKTTKVVERLEDTLKAGG